MWAEAPSAWSIHELLDSKQILALFPWTWCYFEVIGNVNENYVSYMSYDNSNDISDDDDASTICCFLIPLNLQG